MAGKQALRLPQTPWPSQVDPPEGQAESTQAVPAGRKTLPGLPLHPHCPSLTLSLSNLQGSTQFMNPSPSVSISGVPQSQTPRRTLSGSYGHSSMQSWTLS